MYCHLFPRNPDLPQAKRRSPRETIPYICDFSRCRLNVRLTAYIQPLLRGHKYRVWSLLGSCLWRLEENQNSCWRDLRIPRKAVIFQICFRACLKNHSSNLHAPICGIFCLHSVDVARYAALIQAKSPANCNAHLAESIFQTRSSTSTNQWNIKDWHTKYYYNITATLQ